MIGTRLARRLRPIARERARVMKMRQGDVVFYGDIVFHKVEIFSTGRMKPYPHFLFQGNSGKGGVFGGSACYANTDQFHYTLWSILWEMRPKRQRRLENRIRRSERKKALAAL